MKIKNTGVLLPDPQKITNLKIFLIFASSSGPMVQ